MNKQELKGLVMKYFNLTEKQNTQDNNEKQAYASAKLIDGTEITNQLDSEFAEGDVVHVITAEGEHVIAPSGEHELESGIVITINEEGIITGIKRPGEEGEGSLEAAEEDEMSSESVAEKMATETIETSEEKTEMADIEIEEVMEEESDMKETIIEAIMESVAPEIEALKEKMANCEMKLAEHDEKMGEYMSKPADVPSSEKRFNKVSNETKPDVLNKARYNKVLNMINNKKR